MQYGSQHCTVHARCARTLYVPGNTVYSRRNNMHRQGSRCVVVTYKIMISANYVFHPVKSKTAELRLYFSNNGKPFHRGKGLFIETCPENDTFARMFRQTLTNGLTLPVRINLAILAKHQLVALQPRKFNRKHFQLTVKTSNNEHNYDFENMKLGNTQLPRTYIEKIRDNMHLLSPYYKALEEIYAEYTMSHIDKGGILFTIKDQKACFAI